jgi:hypothetical protein
VSQKRLLTPFPGRESGTWAGKTKMSKRGSKYLRTAILQAAQTAV